MPKRLVTLLLFGLLIGTLSTVNADAQYALQAVSTPQAADAQQIADLVEKMRAAVVAQDKALYLSYVDLSDPVFALEHTRWADEWSKQTVVSQFDLRISKVTVDGDAATAELSMTWTTTDQPERTAEYPVVFWRNADGRWLYAGEYWISTDTEHFRVHAAPGLEDAAREVIAMLPDIYTYVTGALAYTPTTAMQIKLYTTSEALIANTLLRLPRIRGWNEPGESLKLWAIDNEPPEPSSLAHEFTHFLSFEMAGTKHSQMPWWLEEGLATYVGSYFEEAKARDGRLQQVRDWANDGKLVSWDQISDFEATPVRLWRYVYPQGYTFVRFITETYGEAKRNAWIKAMSKDASLGEATQSAFGLSFDQLDAQFAAWLKKGNP
jgi:hypothetical protein